MLGDANFLGEEAHPFPRARTPWALPSLPQGLPVTVPLRSDHQASCGGAGPPVTAATGDQLHLPSTSAASFL
jgi:hypothetical protein